MERLTYKLDEPVSTKYLHFEYMRIADYDIDKGNYGRITDDRIYNKLGQLEDIEEELGIDLITLFRALTKGIYIKDDKLIDHLTGLQLDLSLITNEYSFYCDYYIQYYRLKDYGKTWALNKEELENDY